MQIFLFRLFVLILIVDISTAHLNLWPCVCKRYMKKNRCCGRDQSCSSIEMNDDSPFICSLDVFFLLSLHRFHFINVHVEWVNLCVCLCTFYLILPVWGLCFARCKRKNILNWLVVFDTGVPGDRMDYYIPYIHTNYEQPKSCNSLCSQVNDHDIIRSCKCLYGCVCGFVLCRGMSLGTRFIG